MTTKKAKQVIITLAIAVIFLLFVGYGIEVFNSGPEHEDFCPRELYLIDNETECVAAGGQWSGGKGIPEPEEGREFCHEPRECYQEFDVAASKHNKIVFIISTIVGIIALVVGFVIRKEAAATGLVSGALLVIFYGTIRYWRHANDTLKFILLGIVLAVLIWIAYKKLERK